MTSSRVLAEDVRLWREDQELADNICKKEPLKITKMALSAIHKIYSECFSIQCILTCWKTASLDSSRTTDGSIAHARKTVKHNPSIQLTEGVPHAEDHNSFDPSPDKSWKKETPESVACLPIG